MQDRPVSSAGQPASGATARPLEAVIFDLDGTLIDTAPDLMHATNHVLASQGRRRVRLEEIRAMVGQGGRKLVLRGFAATGRPIREDEVGPHYEAFLDYYAAHIAEESRPFPGIMELLDRCLAQGLRLGICTNKLETLSVNLIEALGLTSYFPSIVGPDTLGVAKPNAAPYRETVRRCGVELPRSVLIGDSETDVLTARAAGVPIVAVSYGYTERPVAESAPDHLVDAAGDIWPILEGMLARGDAGRRA